MVNRTAHSQYLAARSETKSINGKTRTIIHTSIRPGQSTPRLKSNQIGDVNSNSTFQLNKSFEPDINTHSSQFDDTSWTQQSFGPKNTFVSSSFFGNTNQTSKNFNDWPSNTNDLLEYSGKKNRRNQQIISIRRCLWLIICLCVMLLLGIIAAIALTATLIKHDSTISPATTTGVITTLMTTVATTNLTTASTTVITTQTTTTVTTETTSTTSIPPTSSVNVSSSTSNFFGYETLDISCSVTLTNITIQIFVQTTVGATYNADSNSFSTGVVTNSHTNTGSEIIYTWTIVSGQIVACVSATYNVKAQFTLSGTAQVTSADTYIVTITTTGGITTVFTGHF